MWLMMMIIISIIIMMIRIVVNGGLGSEPSDQRLFGFINNLSLGCTLMDLCVTFDIKAAKKTGFCHKHCSHNMQVRRCLG